MFWVLKVLNFHNRMIVGLLCTAVPLPSLPEKWMNLQKLHPCHPPTVFGQTALDCTRPHRTITSVCSQTKSWSYVVRREKTGVVCSCGGGGCLYLCSPTTTYKICIMHHIDSIVLCWMFYVLLSESVLVLSQYIMTPGNWNAAQA